MLCSLHASRRSGALTQVVWLALQGRHLVAGGNAPGTVANTPRDPERVGLMPRAAHCLRPLQGRDLSCDRFRGRCPRLLNPSPSGISRGPCPATSARNQSRGRSLACNRETCKERSLLPLFPLSGTGLLDVGTAGSASKLAHGKRQQAAALQGAYGALHLRAQAIQRPPLADRVSGDGALSSRRGITQEFHPFHVSFSADPNRAVQRIV